MRALPPPSSLRWVPMEFSEPEISQNRCQALGRYHHPPPYPRPAFAIAKIDFPETFDRRPEFAPPSNRSSGSSPHRGRIISQTPCFNMAHKPHPQK